MSLEELSSFVNNIKLSEFSSPTVDLAKTLGPGLSHPQAAQPSISVSRAVSTLCTACQAIFTESSPQGPGQLQHHAVDALRTRAGRGCQLCLSIYMSMDPTQLLKFQNTVPSSQGIASFTPIGRDQARLQFRYIPATASEEESSNSKGSTEKQESRVSVNSVHSNAGEIRLLSVDMILVKPECTITPTCVLRRADFGDRRGGASRKIHGRRVKYHRLGSELRYCEAVA